MAYRFSVRVYFSDTDAGGIVYHARYLDFAEHARTELLRHLSSGVHSGQRQLLEERHIGYVVKSISIEYHTPALLDDLLEVETTVADAKRFSITFLQRIFRGETIIATLKVRVACVNLETKRIEPFDPWFAEEANKL